MENKKGSGSAGSLKGKGFYIVLFLCAAVIGVSAWILLAGTNVEEKTGDTGTSDSAIGDTLDVSDAVVTMSPSISATEAQQDAEEQDPESADAPEQASEETTDDKEVFSEKVDSYVWPVVGDVEVPYAMESLQYDATMADWRTHNGIDIACDLGTQVLAAAAGTVTKVYDDDLYGTTVEIDHANGVHTVYANLAAAPTVEEGDIVTMGQVIGAVGNTALGETNEVCHLHFSMTLDGASVDPTSYLP